MISVTDLPDVLKRYLSDTSMSQETLARAVGVHQSTISRLLAASPKQSGPAIRLICKFMQAQGYGASPMQAQKALRAVWDGSPEHDAGLSDLILASQSLRAEQLEVADDD